MEFCSADIETIASAVPSLAVLVLVACDVSESLEILTSVRALEISQTLEVEDVGLPPNLEHLALVDCLRMANRPVPPSLRSMDLRGSVCQLASQTVTELVETRVPDLEWLTDKFPNVKSLVLTYSPDPDSRRELDRLGIAWRVGVEPLFPSVRGWFDSINFS
jgi:hypothetical protein